MLHHELLTAIVCNGNCLQIVVRYLLMTFVRYVKLGGGLPSVASFYYVLYTLAG